jgi:hypothetical protein
MGASRTLKASEADLRIAREKSATTKGSLADVQPARRAPFVTCRGARVTKSWDAWKAWAKLEEAPGALARIGHRVDPPWVTVIVASAPPAALAVRAATSTVPIVFSSGIDPVKLGLGAGEQRRFRRTGGYGMSGAITPA